MNAALLYAAMLAASSGVNIFGPIPYSKTSKEKNTDADHVITSRTK